MQTIKLTTAQAIVKFLDNQYIEFDGIENKYVHGVATVFGHGNVLGLGQALDEDKGSLVYYQGKNEQGMAHMATAYARQNNRKSIIAVSASVGPGSANMVTAAATATVNNIPLLLLCGDTFSTRQPDPVLQQLEVEHSQSTTTNDAFRPVCRYWDRVNRPEQLMSAMLNAMRALTEPGSAGAVCIAMPQDVQGESYDFPVSFLEKRVHRIPKACPDNRDVEDAVQCIISSKKPLVICGGGVKYAGAAQQLQQFCETFNIPLAETQAGKSAVPSANPYNLGGIGVTGNLAANTIAADADCIIAVGSRLSDFTTSSKWLFSQGVKVVSINASRFHAEKLDACTVVADAARGLEALHSQLEKAEYLSSYKDEISNAKKAWEAEMVRLRDYHYIENGFETIVEAKNESSIADFIGTVKGSLTQTEAICKIREKIAGDAIVVGASGSLPGDLQRMWTTEVKDSYHMEYGYSCMGYEISGALGVKIAEPDREVYAMTGDGSFYMLHSEWITAIQEGKKVNILLFDNAGFGCINNLEMGNGVGNFGTEFRRRGDDGEYSGAFLSTDFAAVANAYGAVGYTARTMEELEAALEASKKESRSTLIDIKVLPKTMTEGYESWWHAGVASLSKNDAGKKAYLKKEEERKKARQY